MNEDQLSEKEKQLFEQLNTALSPPDHLLRNTVKRLKEENLIKTKPYTMKTYVKWAASVAAAIVIFYIGRFSAQGVVIDPNKGYMLILHEDEQFKPGDPNEMFKEYGSWMINTFAEGVAITGQELANEAAIVDSEKNVEFLDAQAIGKVTGYFILEANSLEEALEIAKDNPHIKYRGSIEVKKYMVR
jgi:hypothetical protein